jgi:UDP-GlcNAc:undecaprenyl-phosphate GlcNAc-1-phosphate transferase
MLLSSILDHLTLLLGALVGAFALGVGATYATRATARRIGFVAKPRAERWHSRPTALAGGVGIFVAFAVVTAFIGGSLRVPVLAGAGAMFAIGFVDDVFQLKPYAKLTAQLLVAGLTVASGAILPWTDWALANQAITIFWIIGIANAINLLDNMDGLAAGIACIGAVFQGLFFVVQQMYPEAAVCAALAGALGGFLVFNFNPASIFMGDSGSLFLGYTLAVVALHHNYGRSRGLLAVIAAPVLVLLIPIFDTTFVTVTRILRGRPVSQGGRDHTSHRLVTLGLSERKAVMTLWLMGIVAGTVALMTRIGYREALWIGMPLLALALGFVGIHLARTDTTSADGSSPGLLASVAISLAAFGYKRRIFEVLLDASLAMISLLAAFLLRFDGAIPDYVAADLGKVFPIVVAIKVASLHASGAYHGMWKYAGLRDLIRLGRGAFYGSIATVLFVSMWLRFGTLSRGALIIDGLMFAGLVSASRVSFRMLRVLLAGRSDDRVRRVLLWGAGDTGEIMVRQLLESPGIGLVPVGFVDDDKMKIGRTIHGLKVLGSSDELEQLCQSHTVDEVLVTSGQIESERLSLAAKNVGDSKIRRMRLLFEDVGT